MLSMSENFEVFLLQNLIFIQFQKFKGFLRIVSLKIPWKLVFSWTNGNNRNTYLYACISAVCC